MILILKILWVWRKLCNISISVHVVFVLNPQLTAPAHQPCSLFFLLFLVPIACSAFSIFSMSSMAVKLSATCSVEFPCVYNSSDMVVITPWLFPTMVTSKGPSLLCITASPNKSKATPSNYHQHCFGEYEENCD